jgi:hypothetical protein
MYKNMALVWLLLIYYIALLLTIKVGPSNNRWDGKESVESWGKLLGNILYVHTLLHHTPHNTTKHKKLHTTINSIKNYKPTYILKFLLNFYLSY